MQIITALLIITVTAGCAGTNVCNPPQNPDEPPLQVEPLQINEITDDQIVSFRTYIKAEFSNIKEENISISK